MDDLFIIIVLFTIFMLEHWIKGKQQRAWLRKTSQIGKKGATWTPSVSLKVNISDIPPSTLVCRGQRSWWQTSDPGALRGQKRSLWNLSVEGPGTFSPAQKLQLKRQLTSSSVCTWANLLLWDFCETNILLSLLRHCLLELKINECMNSNDFNPVFFCTFPFFYYCHINCSFM